MNSNTASPLGPDFINQILLLFPKAIINGFVWVFSIIKGLVFEHILLIIILFFSLVLFAFLEYLFTGRWALLGSVFYNSLKYVILFFTALIFGAGIFASDWFDIALAILGSFCYLIVGLILKKLDIH
jgi:hypothetical protein